MTTEKRRREFDLVLWGATGFTGQLVAHYLADHPEISTVEWAIAGRNEDKLSALRDELGEQFAALPILIGDALDRESLDTIAARTRVICTTCGPYARYGSNLVAACVEAGTDYCDINGEPPWVREMIDAHHDEAAQRGVRIVHCCGFDSIPSDLGTYLLQSEAISRFGKPCHEVRCLVWKLRGGVSGGTAASAADVIAQSTRDKKTRRVLADPYGLNPRGERSGPDSPFQRRPRRDPLIDAWTGPFIMAAVNEKIVRRSNALLDYRYGKAFRYSEASHLGKGLPAVLRATAMSAGVGLFGAAMALRPSRALLQRLVLPSPGEGPTEETIEGGHFTLRHFGAGTDADGRNFEISTTISADKDPGYGATALMLGESALCLALDDEAGALDGGSLTPATALGDPFVKRLRSAGMTLDVD